MMGHVGDFGLARLLFDATQDFSVDQSSSIEVRGTIGYTPPGIYHYHLIKKVYQLYFLFP